MNKYRYYKHNLVDAGPKISTKSSSSFWSYFTSNEEVPEQEKPAQNVIPNLPEEYKDLDALKGVYLYGNPGTGKTFLMDMLYDEIPVRNKDRLHYAEFMIEIHKREHEINLRKDKTQDTIMQVGKEYSEDIDLLCIDEFQVLHISDAMILKRLFEAFFQNHMI